MVWSGEERFELIIGISEPIQLLLHSVESYYRDNRVHECPDKPKNKNIFYKSTQIYQAIYSGENIFNFSRGKATAEKKKEE